MPRKGRQISEAGVYHFITRGVNQKRLFHRREDYDLFLNLIAEHARYLNLKIYHYCLMNNHAHILLRSPDVNSLSKFGYYLQRRYAYHYSKSHPKQRQVFRKRFISIPINKDSYLLECGRYIERNPVRARLVEDPRNFDYSSYAFYAFGKNEDFLTQNPLFDEMGPTPEERRIAYRAYVNQTRPYEEMVEKTLSIF